MTEKKENIEKKTCPKVKVENIQGASNLGKVLSLKNGIMC
jgi:hypothetical protein